MSELIVAGGTGQEVALAALRLAYLSGIDIPNVTVFDSDVAPLQPGTPAESRTQALQKLHRDLRALGPLVTDKVAFLNPTVLPQGAGGVRKITDLFAQFGHLEPDDETLVELLLDSRQRAATISDGFHGEPALGSLALAAAVDGGAFSGFFEKLRSVSSTQAGLRVVFAGSIVGGMGTAVIPMLADTLARIHGGAAHGRVNILALLQVPWFELVHLQGEALSKPPDVTEAMFDRNSSCLLQGYLDQLLRSHIDSLVLLGLPQSVKRVSHGGHEQLETRHYLCLTAGIYAMNLLRAEATTRMLGANWKGFHAATVSAQPPNAALQGFPGGPSLEAGPRQLSVDQLVKLARSLVAVSASLLFETSTLDPVLAQHQAVYSALLALDSQQRREEFRKSLEGLHRLHLDLLDWLVQCLRSMAGTSRADTINAFQPDGDWDDFTRTNTGSILKQIGSLAPWPSLGRRLLRRCGPLRPPAHGAGGRETAWELVKQARDALLGFL